MNPQTKIAMISLLTLCLTGCADITKQDVGVVTGGLAGGALGSLFGGGSGKILATVGGAVAGAFIGGSIGHYMDKVDRMQMNKVLETACNGQRTTWHNPNTHNTYRVTPTQTFYQGVQPCRDYTTKAIIGGQPQTIYGQACRMADGTWQVVH